MAKAIIMVLQLFKLTRGLLLKDTLLLLRIDIFQSLLSSGDLAITLITSTNCMLEF